MALGAGRAGADANEPILQNVDAVLGGHTDNGERQDMGSVVGTVDLYIVEFT